MDVYPTDFEWFTCFMTGLWSRIGEIKNQYVEISIYLMIEIQRLLELQWQLEVKQKDKERIITAAENGSFHIFTYCGSFRGYKTTKVLLHDIHHHILYLEESVV